MKTIIIECNPSKNSFGESIKEKAYKNPKLDYIWNATVVEVKGDGILTSIVLEDTKTKERREIFADENDGTFGLFVFVGYTPKNDIVEGLLDMQGGYIVTDENMHTNIPGVFAAGDNRKKELRQVVTATADGAIAAVQAEKYIESLEGMEEARC